MRDAQHDDASILLRREPEHVGEVEIKRNEHASLSLANRNQILIACATEMLFGDSGRIVAHFSEELNGPFAEVLV